MSDQAQTRNRAMQFPNWFKIAWWVLLTGLLTAFLLTRYPALVAGRAAGADIVVFLVWVALLLAPLFNEISLLGITFKQELDELRGFVSAQVNEIRSEIKNAIDIRATINPSFYLGAPPPDAQLPKLEAQIKAAVSDALAAHGMHPGQAAAPLAAPDDAIFLFSVRYNIERELRRIAEGRQLDFSTGAVARRKPTIAQLARLLSEAEVVEPPLASAIREVYVVCSPAIHGEPISEAQVAFVKDVASQLIAALRSIQ
jgi:hypothetical protein